MYDQRGCSRWRIDWEARVGVEGKEPIQCRISDINFKGMKITLEEKLKKDAFVKLKLFLSEVLTFDLEAWVVWCSSIEGLHTYGLVFSSIDDLGKDKLYQFVYNNFPKQLTSQWWEGIKIREVGENMEDRRIFERFSARFPVKFLSEGNDRECKAVTQDVSAKGMGMITGEELAVHTPLEMWLQLSDKEEPAYARGEVVWSKMLDPARFMVGVELEKADLMGVSRIIREL
ncbi:MAG TPA: PilZ domain-containing protein [Candidatus Margulisiibacteriota bacterium]|nr:PilZ domain-containing protein [Candidatus Margulisiibacteriota bacterium]